MDRIYRIAAFEVREDERKAFGDAAGQYPVQIELHPEKLTEETISLAEGCDAVTTLGQSRLDRGLLTLLQQEGIHYLSTRTVGYNHIDLTAAGELGIRAAHVDYDPGSVADFTIMLILMSLRRYKQALFRGNANDYSLAGLQGKELRTQTVGVVGTGNIGAAVIRRLSGWGCRVLACGHPKAQLEGMAAYVTKEELFRESDIITFHVPLVTDTYHMVNEYSLACMKDGVILINTARGELMDTEALIAGIESCKIGALGIDVLENESGIYHMDRRSDILSNRSMAYLRQFPNVTMTQHIAFYTEEAVANMVDGGVRTLVEMLSGEPCRLEIRRP